MSGRLAAIHLQADATASAVSRLFAEGGGPESQAATLFGFAAARRRDSHAEQVAALKARHPHWFDTPATA